MREFKATVIIAVLAMLAVSSGCSKNHGSTPSAGVPATYSVRVVAEKVRGSGLMLQNNGGDDLYVTGNQDFKFRTQLVDGEPYNVTVVTQPTGPSQTCTLTNGTGVINGKNATVKVTCTTNKYTVGGTVNGLAGQMILHNNVPQSAYDSLTIDANGAFAFAKEITDGSSYSVSVFRQPSVQTCTVTFGSGSLKGANVDNVALGCVDNVPTISLNSASVIEGDTGTSNLEFSVKLSLLARQNVTVHYSTTTTKDSDIDGVTDDLDLCPGTPAAATVDANGCSTAQTIDDTLARAGNDYTVTTGDLIIYAGTNSSTINVPVAGDTTPEANETLTLTLTKPTGIVDWNATFGVNRNNPITSLTATGTIYNDDGGALNDTGIALCGDYATVGTPPNSNNDLDCAAVGATATVDGTDSDGDPVPAGQDAFFGRDHDPATNGSSDGHAGFSFQKLDSSGNVTTASQWSCVEDLTTKLIWEAKTTDGGLHDKGGTYSWYDTDVKTNGGDPGVPSGGVCDVNTLTACDTETFVTAVNSEGLCGYNDWRLPTTDELSSLIDSSVSSGQTIDTGWFPNTVNAIYWTSSPYANYSYYAWGVDFGNGAVIGNLLKQDGHNVRLVRGGQ